ncbi:hypothetical protein MtrunA17_Chr4g0008041 [Medicago truncatula]|uniref:Uncharacterized protein n=1 Tax=Medicago truncatula TaxID=3880 RepID=A0A396I055_MEDTR|nr:hypothetical protein MtrunA17_Chr4g0008041 [Medicago truncatula]
MSTITSTKITKHNQQFNLTNKHITDYFTQSIKIVPILYTTNLSEIQDTKHPTESHISHKISIH